jgi:uncharacterized protein
MPNRLAQATSPYLLQHKDNPVDWYPWSEEALKKARDEDKPIFLSIGYSACHWCHVMEHESFENEQLATLMNQHFVCIKVDREERPDLDQIYMQAIQMMTGSGGWPMSVFLKPDGQPFYGGTYWPPESRFGRPGFGQVLTVVADAWKTKRDQIDQQCDQLTKHLREACRGPQAADGDLNEQWLVSANRWLLENFDSQHGGFGGAPKFPHAMDLSLLLEMHSLQPSDARRQCVTLTLDKMAAGGIYDHLGGGFARYSVDQRWLVPHFEKMLYDNALLIGLYADAYRLWGNANYARTVRESLEYALTQMTDANGAFYSSEDADSEGEEGKFYVWTRSEITAALGVDRANQFSEIYDVTDKGNFEGHNILNLPQPVEEFAKRRQLDVLQINKQLAEDRVKLFELRAKRVRPGLDDKVLLSWNALMVTALVKGFRSLGEPRYLHAALKCTNFVRQEMRLSDGRLWHTWRRGQANVNAYLDDYAYWIDALAELFQVHSDPLWLQWSLELAEIMLKDFSDPAGGFFYTATGHEQLIARNKDIADSSVPSGNSMASSGLLTLGRLSGRAELVNTALGTLKACSGVLSGSPQAAGQSLRGLHRALLPSQEWFLVGGQDESEFSESRSRLLKLFRPDSVTVICRNEAERAALDPLCPLVVSRPAVNERATLYACTDSVCQQPIVGLEKITAFARSQVKS